MDSYPLSPRTFARIFNCALVIVFTCLGCGGPDFSKQVAELNKNNVQRLANCYLLFQHRNGNFDGPSDKAEFIELLAQERVAKNLKQMGIDRSNLESLFISERDQAEIKVRYGLRGGQMGPYHPVTFETEGLDGVRLVGFTSSEVKEIRDDAQYEALLAGKVKPEQAETELAPD
ncbi:MAG: hypothetical protein RH917_06585 [Lacipirellulaceae bacterium]